MDKLDIIQKKKSTFCDAVANTEKAMSSIDYVIAHLEEYDSTPEEIKAYLKLKSAHSALHECYKEICQGAEKN